MGRILFFLVLAVAVYIGWRYWRIQQPGAGARPGRGRRPGETDPEPMVRCDVCGLNVPRSEALPAPDAGAARWYCSDAHRRQGEDRP